MGKLSTSLSLSFLICKMGVKNGIYIMEPW